MTGRSASGNYPQRVLWEVMTVSHARSQSAIELRSRRLCQPPVHSQMVTRHTLVCETLFE